MIGKHSQSTERGSHRSVSRIIITHVHHKTELVGQTSSFETELAPCWRRRILSPSRWFIPAGTACNTFAPFHWFHSPRVSQSLSQSQWKRGACWYVTTKLPLSAPPSRLCCFLNANEGSPRRWAEANMEPCLAPPSNKRLMSTLGNTFCSF